MTIVGFVTKVDWVNPHAFVYLDSKDDKGAVHSYRIEMGPPYALQRGGWKKDTLKIGDKDHHRERGPCEGWQQHRRISPYNLDDSGFRSENGHAMNIRYRVLRDRSGDSVAVSCGDLFWGGLRKGTGRWGCAC